MGVSVRREDDQTYRDGEQGHTQADEQAVHATSSSLLTSVVG
jgi:hypothetical protein